MAADASAAARSPWSEASRAVEEPCRDRPREVPSKLHSAAERVARPWPKASGGPLGPRPGDADRRPALRSRTSVLRGRGTLPHVSVRIAVALLLRRGRTLADACAAANAEAPSFPDAGHRLPGHLFALRVVRARAHEPRRPRRRRRRHVVRAARADRLGARRRDMNFPLRLSAWYAAVSDPDCPGPPSLTEHAVYRHRLGAADLPRIEKALRGYGAPHTFLTLTASRGVRATLRAASCRIAPEPRRRSARLARRLPAWVLDDLRVPARATAPLEGDRMTGAATSMRGAFGRRSKRVERTPDLGHGRFDVRRFRAGEAARARARRACDGRLPRAHLARERGGRRVAGGTALREGETGGQRACPIREHRHRHARTTRRPCRDARHRSRPRVPAVRDHRRRQREHD
jgi:hypothetical protein